MKKLIAVGIVGVSMLMSAVGANADVRVRGYVRSDGAYVAPHYRSNPDGNQLNNFSTQGNVNAYTGNVGTRNPYGSSDMLNRSSNAGDMLGRSWGSKKLY